jgi:uncharacterized protein YecA (UPF0149 family)
MAHEQFAPQGLLECSFVDEVVRAMWRLRRCGEIEASFVDTLAAGSGPIPDAMQNEATARLQNSVDRARAQAHRLLQRCTKELRQLQTERHFRNEVLEAGTDIADLGVCDFRALHKAASGIFRTRDRQRQQQVREQMESYIFGYDPGDKGPETTFAERTQSQKPFPVEIARNASCPCNSGKKYKRCCGPEAPALRNAA